jgi:hypothetical protein
MLRVVDCAGWFRCTINKVMQTNAYAWSEQVPCEVCVLGKHVGADVHRACNCLAMMAPLMRRLKLVGSRFMQAGFEKPYTPILTF